MTRPLYALFLSVALLPLVGCANLNSPQTPEQVAQKEQEAKQALHAGQTDKAAGLYRSILQAQPDNAAALAGLARTQVMQGKLAEAEANYAKSVDVTPMPSTFAGYGAVFDLKGNHAGAQDAYRRGLAMDPDHPGLRNNMALSLAMTGQYDKAVDILKSVVDKAPDNTEYKGNLALVYALNGQDNAARRSLMTFLKPDEVERNMFIYGRMRQQGGGESLRDALRGSKAEAAAPQATPAP